MSGNEDLKQLREKLAELEERGRGVTDEEKDELVTLGVRVRELERKELDDAYIKAFPAAGEKPVATPTETDAAWLKFFGGETSEPGQQKAQADPSTETTEEQRRQFFLENN